MRIGIDAARCDAKLVTKRIKKWSFILFVFRLASLGYGQLWQLLLAEKNTVYLSL